MAALPCRAIGAARRREIGVRGSNAVVRHARNFLGESWGGTWMLSCAVSSVAQLCLLVVLVAGSTLVVTGTASRGGEAVASAPDPRELPELRTARGCTNSVVPRGCGAGGRLAG